MRAVIRNRRQGQHGSEAMGPKAKCANTPLVMCPEHAVRLALLGKSESEPSDNTRW